MTTHPFKLPHVDLNSLDLTSPPVKRIESSEDLSYFLSSQAYKEIKLWLLQLTRSCLPHIGSDGKVAQRRLDVLTELSPTVLAVKAVLKHLDEVLDQTPPEAGPRRFGNAAFRTWFKKVEDSVEGQLRTHLSHFLPHDGVYAELKTYLLGSFGSAQRLDYGTGHELSFLAFLGVLWKGSFFMSGDEWLIVTGTIQPYLLLVRKLIKQYTLEPAGSHGVWGLDDHSFIPYIFGSAQFAPALPAPTDGVPCPPTPVEGSVGDAPDPASITSSRVVAEQELDNLYFGAIAFILDVKKGPFFEHSPYLYNISGIKDGWGKINKGMLKMYDAEVLGKFPVVQHFPFGSFWRWELVPGTRPVKTVHMQHQPMPAAAPLATAEGSTKAPWAVSTPDASTKAPWAGSSLGPPKTTNIRGLTDRR